MLNQRSDLPETAVEIPTEAYISPEYARAERKNLWDRLWQIACREEEIPNVGDYYTYDILGNSAIVVRTEPDRIAAYYNTCRHRGRRLTNGCGNTDRFRCKYHAWQYLLNGENAHIPDRQDWGGQLNEEIINLGPVKTARWAGFVFVNFAEDCEPFEEFIDTVPYWIDPFEMGQMRYKWRRWAIVPCNWKVISEAFIETYHSSIIHPQNLKFSNGRGWARSEGLHSALGTANREGAGFGMSVDGAVGKDHRKTALSNVTSFMETVRGLTTDTFIAAAKKLFEVLPETASATEVSAKMAELTRQMDRDRGVVWPDVSADHLKDTGFSWHVFPNSMIQPGLACGLYIRIRPNGYDPDSCIFEVHALERFPPGEAPSVEFIHEPELTAEKWGLLWAQDFENLPDVQRGMKCSGRQAVRPNPVVEKAIVNFHRNLARYMGTGAPEPLR